MKLIPGHQRRLSLASSLVFAVLAANAQVAELEAPGMSVNPAARAPARDYSVINLVSLDGYGVLNQRGQVAFTGYIDGRTAFGFFDGKRTYPILLPVNGIGFAWVYDLNDAGVAVLEADDPVAGFPFNARAFKWSLGTGAQSLTGAGGGLARAINERNQIVGYVQVNEQSGRSNRWNPDGSQTRLGRPPTNYSEAMAINDNGVSAGYYENRATVWDANGRAIDLGTMGGTGAIATLINAKDQVAGTFITERGTGVFMWRQKGGLTTLGPYDRLVRVAGLNDHGVLAANRQVGQEGLIVTFAPFTWSAKRGVTMLPLAGAAHGRVDSLNNRGEMVGYTQRVEFDDSTRRAVYWRGTAMPVDLNTRLYRAPAGLLLSAATAINDDGTILATSNAGLVLLRPGRTGTTAPVLGPLVAPSSATVGTTVDFSISFSDGDPTETHTAAASVNDGCPQIPPSLRETRGIGDVSVRHTFCRSGTFLLRIAITDRARNTTQSEQQIYVGDALGRR